jgi:hypothetical protein
MWFPFPAYVRFILFVGGLLWMASVVWLIYVTLRSIARSPTGLWLLVLTFLSFAFGVFTLAYRGGVFN